MKILLTNDDGIHAQGIRALAKGIAHGHEVVIAAPASEKSASSHSISLGQRLVVAEVNVDGLRGFAVEGTPADCVKFAISSIEDFYPELIVSGINHGANTGVSVYYSGTISAAREGFINLIPSMAISLASRTFRDFSASAEVARRLVGGYQAGVFPANVMLNINVPPLEPQAIRGIKVAKQAASRFVEEFLREKDEHGKRIYSLAGEIEMLDSDGTSDEEVVADGFVSLTPLKLDLTDYASMPVFEKWLTKNAEGS